MRRSTVSNPSRAAATRYAPTATGSLRYEPSACVTRSVAAFVASLTILTDAPGSTPPDESLTTPEMKPELPWARPGEDVRRRRAAATTNERSERNMEPPGRERRL